MARKKKRRWPLLLGILSLIGVLLWIFRPYIESRLRPAKPKPSIGREKVQEEISEEERKNLEEILKNPNR